MVVCKLILCKNDRILVKMLNDISVDEMESMAAVLLKAISMRGASVFAALQKVDDVKGSEAEPNAIVN